MANRSAVAQYAAKVISLNNDTKRQSLVLQLSAWLKTNNKTSDTEYLVNDIAKVLATLGYYYITVTSARQLSQPAKETIEMFLIDHFGKNANIELVHIIEPSIIGGVVITTPEGVLDASVKNKLIQLVKGANEV